MLSDTKVRALKPKAKPYKAYDQLGLYIQIEISGTKSWRYRFKYDEKFKVMTLGKYPRMTLKQARADRNQQADILEQGLNPILKRKLKKAKNIKKSRDIFKKTALKWHEKNQNQWTSKHSRQVLKSLEREVFSDFGDIPIKLITAKMVLKSIQGIEKRGALETAKRTLQRVNAVFNYALLLGKIKTSPTSHLHKLLTKQKKDDTGERKGHAVLDKKELPEFLHKLDSYNTNLITRYAMNFLILTMTRTAETRLATWDEIQGDKWTIPAARMKMGREHVIPLSKQAKQILKAIEPITGNDKYIFTGRCINKPLSSNTMIYAMYRMGYHSRATVHGFRTLASTILNNQNFNRAWIEKQLAHEFRQGSEKHYNKAEYLPQRADMLQKWADFLDEQRKLNQLHQA